MSPAMIAEIRPQIGGAPDATAIPSENGSDIRETTSPAVISCRQCLRPATPLHGFSVRRVEPLCMEDPHDLATRVKQRNVKLWMLMSRLSSLVGIPRETGRRGLTSRWGN